MSFHEAETTRHGGAVPWAMTEPAAAALHRRMRGTAEPPRRCVALDGAVGISTSCAIYEARPGVCRDLEPGSEHCNRARALHGLAPIG